MITLEQRLGRAYARMNLHEPFRGAVFSPIPYSIGDKGTAWVDGTRAYYGREFCDKLTDDELLFVVLHEATHVIFEHMYRRDGRDARLWNIATDAVINADLMRQRYTMPKGGVAISWVTPDHDAEAVYNRLKRNPPPPPPDGDGGQSGDSDESGDSGSGGGGDKPDAERGQTGGGGWDGTGDCPDAPTNEGAGRTETTARIMAAARALKAAGMADSLVNRALETLGKPVVPWQDTLADYMHSHIREGYSYRRFSRRALCRGQYLPGRYSDAVGGIVIGFDTSGSISQADAEQIAAEITAICSVVEPEWVEVVHCDTKVRHIERFDRGDDITLKPKGGGGTALQPVLNRVQQLADDENVELLIYFTDLHSMDINALTEPPVPVVWAVLTPDSGARRPRFGACIDVRV
jgi:predicted metal-dependent peptidase